MSVIIYYNCNCILLKVLDLTRPLDKRVYRGTLPTCHDFNITTASLDRVLLIIGFSAGQIQLIDPVSKELSRLYNEEAGSITVDTVSCTKADLLDVIHS